MPGSLDYWSGPGGRAAKHLVDPAKEVHEAHRLNDGGLTKVLSIQNIQNEWIQHIGMCRGSSTSQVCKLRMSTTCLRRDVG